MPDLSVIIPSHNDIYLQKTVDSVLCASGENTEVVVVVDGYRPKRFAGGQGRVRIVQHAENRGMREAINTGVAASQAPYIMRLDEHCMVGPGFDRTILETIHDNWIVTPRRYKLDPEKWERMDRQGFIDYEKLLIIQKPNGRRKFHGVEWKDRRDARLQVPLDETMAMQGSCWVMPRVWWNNVIGRLDSNGYGTLYQDTTEMLFKTWRAGGKLMVNKLTWFAHKHRSFNRTHNYPGELADASFAFALKTWEADYGKVRQAWKL